MSNVSVHVRDNHMYIELFTYGARGLSDILPCATVTLR